MSNKQKNNTALGKGMSALLSANGSIGANNSSASQQPVKTEVGTLLVPIEKIEANKGQPRKIFKEKELTELSQSIKENGIIQPITVKALENGKFQIIAGERRYRASKLAGLDKVPVIVKKTNQKEQLVMAIIENVQRSDLNCIEEALAYYQLMSEHGLTQEEVAIKIGKERSTIANFLRLIKLPRIVVQSLQKDELSFGHGKILAGVKEDELCKRLARRAIDEGLSVRELEKLSKSAKRSSLSTTKTNKFFDERLDFLKQKLENKTGFHFNLKSQKSGSGEISIKFSNEAELNDIYEYLLGK